MAGSFTTSRARVVLGVAALAALGLPARAQPASVPSSAPLAQLGDEPRLAAAVREIAQDPSVPVTDPATRARAQALITEAVSLMHARSYDQALANLLDAYATLPSASLLIEIAATLRDMGRLADAANTYQRYLRVPSPAPQRAAEVRAILLRLDDKLTLLTVHVSPPGAELSIDAGPFVSTPNALVTRVRPGLHLVRIRDHDRVDEITLHGFEGEHKEVSAAVPGADAAVSPPLASDRAAPPAVVDGWLITGTAYTSASSASNRRTVRAGYDGPELASTLPPAEPAEPSAIVVVRRPSATAIRSGVIAVMRVDGKLRGFAGGLGFAIARDRVELEIMALRSEVTGAYLGGRYQLWRGVVRPYAALGLPGFVFEQPATMGGATTRLAIGIRAAAGVELVITDHLSVHGDLGYEHFLNVASTRFEADVFVPTLGVIGRM